MWREARKSASRLNRSLYYSVRKPRPVREIWILPLGGSERAAVPFTGSPYQQDQIVVAPDSRSVIYSSIENGYGRDLYLQSLSSNRPRWQITTSGGTDPQWRGDGREFFYYANDAIMAADVTAPGAPGAPHRLFPIRVTASGRNRFVVSKDGQRFLVITPAEARDPDTTPFIVILNWPRLLENR